MKSENRQIFGTSRMKSVVFSVVIVTLCKSPFVRIFQPAHVKACFLGSNLTVPVSDGKLNLGTWQGVWLCEHRDRAGSRKILVTVNGALRDPDRTPLSPNSPIASTSS